jgi:hypothetical protein
VELGELDYAEEFINKYTSDITELHKGDAVNYGKALISFFRKDFDKALQYSSKIGGNFFLTDQKVLRIMLFVEKGFSEECNAEVKAFKKFLQINKFLSPQIRESLERFLFFIPYITTYGKKKLISKKKLNQMFNEKNVVLFKGWMFEKINGL